MLVERLTFQEIAEFTHNLTPGHTIVVNPRVWEVNAQTQPMFASKTELKFQTHTLLKGADESMNKLVLLPITKEQQ